MAGRHGRFGLTSIGMKSRGGGETAVHVHAGARSKRRPEGGRYLVATTTGPPVPSAYTTSWEDLGRHENRTGHLGGCTDSIWALKLGMYVYIGVYALDGP